MKVSVLAAHCAREAGDADYVVWTTDNWLTYYNAAVKVVIGFRPDDYSVKRTLTLAAGTWQSITTGDLKLLRVLCNTPDGTAAGDAVNGPVNERMMDLSDPSWRSATESGTILEYTWSESTPRNFEVSPPAIAGTQVWVIDAAVPDEATDADTDDIALPLNRYDALREWMMYLAMAGDDERTPNWARAGRHFQAFFSLMNMKLQIDMAANPKEMEIG